MIRYKMPNAPFKMDGRQGSRKLLVCRLYGAARRAELAVSFETLAQLMAIDATALSAMAPPGSSTAARLGLPKHSHLRNGGARPGRELGGA